jgi:hypothetical protein
MQQLTLEDAAKKYHESNYGEPADWQEAEHMTQKDFQRAIMNAFKAGAKSQKANEICEK